MSSYTVANVMTHGAVSAARGTPYHDLVDMLETRAVNAVPVIDSFDRVVGVVSASDLLHKIEFAGGADPPRVFEGRRHRADRRKSTGMTAADLMNAPAVTVSSRTSVTVAARLMETANVRRLPVIDDLGRLVGMVTNRDLLKVFLRPDINLRRHVLTDILPTVSGDAATVIGVEVIDGVVTLTGEVDLRSSAEALAGRVGAIDGVVSVDNQIRWQVDDNQPTGVTSPFAF
jgi:CBS-domain-containing membrane protein